MDCLSFFHKHIGNTPLLGLTIKVKREKKKRERMKEKREKKKESNVICDLFTGLKRWVKFNTSLFFFFFLLRYEMISLHEKKRRKKLKNHVS